MAVGVTFVQSVFGGLSGETLWGVALMLLGDKFSQGAPRSAGSCSLPSPSSTVFPEPAVWEWGWAPGLYLHWLWFLSWSPSVEKQFPG